VNVCTVAGSRGGEARSPGRIAAQPGACSITGSTVMPCAAAAATMASALLKSGGAAPSGCRTNQRNAVRTDSTPELAMRSHSPVSAAVSGPSAVTPSQPCGTRRSAASAGAASSTQAVISRRQARRMAD
jgi:hypothetical protein